MITALPSTEVVTQAADQLRRETFLRLMDEYQAALHRLAGAYVNDAADREDLLQEIAAAVWKALPSFRGECSERTWLYRVAHNTAITASARVRRRARSESALDIAPEPAATTATSEERAIREQQRAQLLAAIRRLPSTDRQIVLLHLEGLGRQEIAEVTGLTEGAIATRLSRTRDALTAVIRRQEDRTI